MRILGIDPGSICTGFGVIDSDRGKLLLIEQGSINTSRGAELADRLCAIHEQKRRIIRPESLAEMRRVLVDGGSGVYVTDHREYFERAADRRFFPVRDAHSR